MAIITHRTSRNARYSDVLDYYSFRHAEDQRTGHYEPILDENGLMIERTNYVVAYITADGQEADPEFWATACMKTNLKYGKNKGKNDRKSHEYIISHPAEDREKMSIDDLLQEGRAFIRENLQGYDALMAVHRDTGNDHIHISINSVRAKPRIQEEAWMMRDHSGRALSCEMGAGGKHQDSPGLRQHMNDWLLDYTRGHGFAAKDNNAIAQQHRAERHGRKNDSMRESLLESASRSRNMTDLQRILKESYGMVLKLSGTGNTISVLYPGNQKYVRLRTLGLESTDLTRRFIGSEYAFTTDDEMRQARREFEEKERKKYIEWIRERRRRNNSKAEEAAERAERILAQQLRDWGDRYSRAEFRDLMYLIRQTAWVEAALQTELDKVDRLTDRWSQYQNATLSERERWQHGSYVCWCGCDPDNLTEWEDLMAERAVIESQRDYTHALHEALLEEGERWKGRNDLTYAENKLQWAKYREKQLKQQLRHVRSGRRHLGEIASNCVCIAERYERKAMEGANIMPDQIQKKWDNVSKFEHKWAEKVLVEKDIRIKLREVRKKKENAKELVKLRRDAVREQGRGR